MATAPLTEEAQILNAKIVDVLTGSGMNPEIFERYSRGLSKYEDLTRWRRNSKHKKSLPYHDFRTWRKIYDLGTETYDGCPLLRAAIDTMVSYVVGKKVTYTACARKHYEDSIPEELLTNVEKSISRITDAYWWHEMQEESIVRLFRDGEFFRRLHLSASKEVTVRFVEPYAICDNDQKPGLDSRSRGDGFGIVRKVDDAVEAEGYWVVKKIGTTEQSFEFVTAEEIQHCTHGVDQNDPRGIPVGYLAYCPLMSHAEVNTAMVELALTQASFAAVRNYDSAVQTQLIDQISKGEQARLEDNGGRPIPGQIVDAKGFQLELPGAKINAAAFIEILSQLARQLGLLLSMPEFMITGDADTGSRSSLVSAEGPFDRRVSREQNSLGSKDVDLLWQAVAVDLSLNDSQVRELREAIHIQAKFQSAVSRDKDREAQSIISLVAATLLSRRTAISQLFGDPDTEMALIEKELEEMGVDNLSMFLNPGQRVAAQNQNARADVPAQGDDPEN